MTGVAQSTYGRACAEKGIAVADPADPLVTRITEAMTQYECGEHTGVGMSEYLDQVVDGRPTGPDVDG